MRALKQTALRLLSSGPVYASLRRVALRTTPTLILCYHTLGPDNENFDAWTVAKTAEFRRHINFLRRSFDIVSLDEALAQDKPIERPRAVITFDDGDVGLYTHLLPVVEAEAIPVTLYIATSQIETGTPYWFDRIMNALQNSEPTAVEIELERETRKWRVGPETGVARWMVMSDILETLKRAHPQERETLTQSILQQAGPARSDFTRLAPLTPKQLAALSKSPHVTIGAHSHCHNLLDQISLDEADISIRRSKQLLQGWTNQTIDHFAYPNGNHNSALQQVVRDAGFKSATILGSTLCTSLTAEPYAIPRVLVGRYDSMARLRLRFIGY